MIMGCAGERTDATQRTAAAAEHTPVHIDSILPIEEEVRRFRAATGRTATHLVGGETSRDALVARIAAALEAEDTAALAGLVIDAAEFIDLYYPHSMFTTAPHELSPALVWMLFTQNGQKGLGRALRQFGGRLDYAGYECPGPARQEGPNRIWEGCVVLRATADEAGPARLVLFGSIMERDGEFKLLSWSNDL
jgi:hypothetical protein